MQYISLKSIIFLSANLYTHAFGQDETEHLDYTGVYEPVMPMNQFHFGQAETEETIDIAAAYRLGVTTDQRVFLNDETKEEPKTVMFETGVPNGYLKNSEGSPNMSNTLGVSGWDLLYTKPWAKQSKAAAEYTEDGRVYKILRNEAKVKMSVVTLCGDYFYVDNIFWKGGYSGNHLHQDNKNNQAWFVVGVTQATTDTDGGDVVRDKPIKIMTGRTSSACGVATPSWTDNGNWGKLGDIIDHFISIWTAPKETCAISPSHGGGNGLQCDLPCDPISPMWLESTDRYLRKAGVSVPGKGPVYSVLYKLRGQFNRGDGNGGLRPADWLNAQCSGDNLYFKPTPSDPTWVVFWEV